MALALHVCPVQEALMLSEDEEERDHELKLAQYRLAGKTLVAISTILAAILAAMAAIHGG